MKDSIINGEFINYLEALTLNMKNPERGFFGGIHQTKAYGSSVEFADFSEYNLGDDIKRIDWNLYARFEKYFLKLYVDEKQMHIQLFLDCSGSMNFYKQKKETALKILTTLGYLAVNNMDRLSIYLIYGDNAYLMNDKVIVGKDSFYEIVPALDKIEFKGESNLEKAITKIERIGYGDGITAIISDFLMDDTYKNACNYLLYKHKQVLLFHILSYEEISPSYNGRVVLLDSEVKDILDDRHMKMRITKAELEVYNRALNDYFKEIYNFSTSRNIGYIKLNADEPFEKIFLEKLFEQEVIK